MKETRVLIIEDDLMVIDINRSVVSEVPGFKVVGSARTAAHGLESVKKLKPNLIILDIFMPQGSGIDFLKDLRKNAFDMDVIMVTAAQDLLYLKECLRYGVVDYIIKPFRLERLKTALQNYQKKNSKLQGKHSINQSDIDFMINSYEVEDKMPKGMSLHTLNLIKNHLAGHNDFHSSDEIADQLGLARVTVRRYLEYLVLNQDAEINMEYGSIGRPLKKYKYRRD